jgi:Ca2+-binding RTX toxin-like protein
LGGSGQDTLKLDLSAITTNLVIENPINSNTLPGVASLKNFEQINLTTGSGSDRITQGSIINAAVFRSSDIFNGGAGDDFIDAGLGLNDRVDGGAGNDTLVVNYSADDVGGRMLYFLGEATTNGVSGAITRNTGNGSDWLDSIGFVGIENFQITGTRLDDEIITWNGNDIINAGTGNDEISPGIGSNIVNAGDGNDQITLIPGGDSNVDGGAGRDSVVIDLSSQTTGFNLTFNAGTFPGIGSISNIEYIVVQGSNSDDVINLDRAVGFGLYNEGVRVEGRAGNDNVTGGSGADWLFGEIGNDI